VFYLGICLTTEEKSRKTLNQGKALIVLPFADNSSVQGKGTEFTLTFVHL
jgi:hypothetical protein